MMRGGHMVVFFQKLRNKFKEEIKEESINEVLQEQPPKKILPKYGTTRIKVFELNNGAISYYPQAFMGNHWQPIGNNYSNLQDSNSYDSLESAKTRVNEYVGSLFKEERIIDYLGEPNE